MASIIEMWERGGQAAREGKQRTALSQYLQPATQGDSGALTQLYQAGLGEQAMGAQKFATEQRSLQREDAGKAASMFAQTGDPQYYAMWRQSLSGLPNAPQLPEALEPGEVEQAKQSAQMIAQHYGGMQSAEVPSAIRELQMLAQNPELAKLDMQRRQAGFGRPHLIQTADGYAWATPEGASPLNYGGGAQPAPQQSGQPFSIDPSLPPNVQAAIRSNEQAWASAPDQSTVTLPPVIQAQGQRVMPAPKAAGEETFSQPQVVTNPQTGKQELVQFGNRGGRRLVSDYAPPPTSRDAKPPTEGERNAAGYYSRMESAERELGAITASGHDATNRRDFYTAGQGPWKNWAATDQGQMYRQQQEDWVRAKLRKESGAVIGDDEMEREIKVYFPQPGDSKAVLQQKAHSRKIAIEAMKKSGGRAIDTEASAGGSPKVIRYDAKGNRIQ